MNATIKVEMDNKLHSNSAFMKIRKAQTEIARNVYSLQVEAQIIQ